MFNDYYIRALPADWPELLQLGEKLGAITVSCAPRTDELPLELRPDGTVAPELGERVIAANHGGAWDYLGEIQRPTGELDPEGNPIMAPVAAPDGTPYLHANLRTPISLGAVARKLAVTDPEVAEAMQRLDRYFLLDDEGSPRLPRQPVRVWF